MALDVRLTGTLLVVLLAAQGVCWLLARGLGRRLERAALICGLVAPIALLAPWLSADRLLVPCDALIAPIPGAPHLSDPDPHDLLNDVLYQLLPWELEVRHAFAAHRLPFWSDLLEGGSSPWVNPQAAVLSPIRMAARAFPIQHALLAALALKILIAFDGTWLLARRAGRSRAASLLAAGGFALGGGITAWGLFPNSATAAFAPWLAVAVIGLFRRPRARAVAVTALVTAALLLSGHPETAAIAGLFAALCGFALSRRRSGAGRGFAASALAAGLGFCLAAPLLLPFLAVVPESQRADETLARTLPPLAARPFALSTWFVPGYQGFMLAPVNPHAFGRPYVDPFRGPINWADVEPGYAGLVAFAGAVVALFALRDRRARPFLGFALLALLLAAQFLPLLRPLYAAPPLRTLAYSRFLLVGSLALAVAGAFGVDRLLAVARRIPGRVAVWIALALAAAASLALAADPQVLLLWGLLAASALLAGWRPRWAAWGLALVLVLDLVPWSRDLQPAGHVQLFYPRTPLLAQLAETAGDGRSGRAVGAELLVYSSLLPVYGIADPRPHNPLAPMRYLRVLDAAFEFHPSMNHYFSRFANVDHPLLDFLGVRAVVGSPAMPPSRKLQPIDGGRYAPFTLYRNPGALPRWFVPAAAETIAADGVRGWVQGMTDASRVALLREEVGDWKPALFGRTEPVAALAASPGHLALAAPQASGETLVATSIPLSAGWRATGDGRPLRTLTVDGAFLGVRVPSGVQRIELRFVPRGFVAGCVLCAVGLLGCLALFVCSQAAWDRRRPRRL